MSNPLSDMELPDVIFCIGTNMTECHPVAATRLKKAIARGAKMIVADPRKIGLVRYAEHYLPLRKAVEDDDFHMFIHHPVGIFALVGEGVQEGVTLEGMQIQDFGPTILHYLGLPVPDTMEGRVLTEAFVEPGEVLTETPPRWMPGLEETKLSLEEQQAVEARLRGLGYL